MLPVNATGHAVTGNRPDRPAIIARSARKSAQKQPGRVPPIANWAVKRQLGRGHAKTDPILHTEARIPVTIVEQGSGAAPQAAPDLIKETTTQTFVRDVIEESKRQPVLIDFWAPWGGPCRELTPLLEKAVRAAKGKVKLVKMNIDEHPAIPGQMGIQSIPAVIAFVNGQPADGFMGALPEGQVTAFIERLTKDKIGGGAQDLVAQAEAALAPGDPARAAEIYAAVLAEEPANVAAMAGLARAYFDTGQIDKAKQTLAMVPEPKRNDPAGAAGRRAMELAEQAAPPGPGTELDREGAAQPPDHPAPLHLAP